MGDTTSIHIKPCITQSSENHNLRHKALPHLLDIPDSENAHLVLQSISATRQAIEARYIASTGQKMQKKATPIREGVVVISPSTSIKDLQKLGEAYKNRSKTNATRFCERIYVVSGRSGSLLHTCISIAAIIFVWFSICIRHEVADD